MEQLVHAWDVLATMTPPEYSAIRPYARREQRVPELAVPADRVHARQQERGDAQAASRTGPTCWRGWRRRCGAVALRRGDAAARAPRPADAGRAHIERDWTPALCRRATRSSRRGSSVYRDPERHWDLYQLGEELIDLEDIFRLWRFRHVTTVERVIGFKRGTGGTSGVELPAQDARRGAVPRDLEAAYRLVS